MLNRMVPAAAEGMSGSSPSFTIASAIAAHKAAGIANGKAHDAREYRRPSLTNAETSEILTASNVCFSAERAAWGAFLDVPCVTSADVQAKIAHAHGEDGAFDEMEERERLLRSLVLPVAAPVSVLSPVINVEALASFTMDDLSSLHDAAITLANVTAAFRCQPRFLDTDGFYNASGNVMADLNTLLCELREATLSEARGRQPTDAEDRETRSWVIRLDAANSRDGVDVPGTMDAMGTVGTPATSPIEEMVMQLVALVNREGKDDEADDVADAQCEAFSALQTRIVTAEAKTPRDVALQFMADTFFGTTNTSDQFMERLTVLGGRTLPAEETTADPLLALVTAYQDGSVAYDARVDGMSDADGDALAEATWAPHYVAMRDGPPSPTTMHGVIQGIRAVLTEEESQGKGDHLTANMLRAILAYLDGRA